ncbi:MAG TPA: hypothetical protein VHZ03_41320 [Trebonia sp.]|jgi:hypothetical protein|nr:hypothetical protein [Trebonia sp.]
MDVIDYREPAREALGRARDAIKDAEPDLDPYELADLLATLGNGYAAMTVSGAIMSTGTQAIRMIGRVSAELAGIRAELARVNEAIR